MAMLSFFPFSFEIFLIMNKKKPKQGKSPLLTIDQWSKENFSLASLPKRVKSSGIPENLPKYTLLEGTIVVRLKSGWFVWCYQDGKKMLSAFPF
jgi:hypothetical protein